MDCHEIYISHWVLVLACSFSNELSRIYTEICNRNRIVYGLCVILLWSTFQWCYSTSNITKMTCIFYMHTMMLPVENCVHRISSLFTVACRFISFHCLLPTVIDWNVFCEIYSQNNLVDVSLYSRIHNNQHKDSPLSEQAGSPNIMPCMEAVCHSTIWAAK